MTTYKLPTGKELETYYEGYLTKVRFKGGGVLPDCLNGSWTDPQKADQCIIKYLNDKEPLYIEEKDENGIFQRVKNPNKDKKGV
jgi:hypothetical protein